MTERYVTLRAAARYLGISEVAIRVRVQRRTIPFIKDGTRVRFDLHELDKHMKSMRVATGREAKASVTSAT